MKIKSIRKRSETVAEKRNVKLILSEVKNVSASKKGSVELSTNATPIEKMKYSLVRDFLVFKNVSGLNQTEIAKLIGINKSRMTEILHYRTSKFSLDTLIQYLFLLKGRVREIDLRIAEIANSFDIAS